MLFLKSYSPRNQLAWTNVMLSSLSAQASSPRCQWLQAGRGPNSARRHQIRMLMPPAASPPRRATSDVTAPQSQVLENAWRRGRRPGQREEALEDKG